ncbi:Uncharacterized protein HDU89_008272 [Geranomyces variabilis]|nr:Uncharacterized protein HDU89_008272 [Geranomyces variabilis]
MSHKVIPRGRVHFFVHWLYGTWRPAPQTAPYPAIPVVEHKQGGNLCGNGPFPFRPRLDIVRPCLRRILHPLRGIETTAEEYSDPFIDGSDDAGFKVSPVYDPDLPQKRWAPVGAPSHEAGADGGRRPYDLRLAILDAFPEEELVNLSEIVVQAAFGITMHSSLGRGTFHNELHRISEKRQLDPDHEEIDRMLVGLTIRVEREISGIAERFLDVLNGTDSVLFVGNASVGKTALLRDVCHYLAKKAWPHLLCLVDSSQELGGACIVPHRCFGQTRVFGGLGWKDQLDELTLSVLRNHTGTVLATDELTNPAEIKAVKKMRDNGVRIVATTYGSYIDILLHQDKNVLLGGTNTVTITDDVASQKEVFNHSLECNETVVEVRSTPTGPSVRSAAKWTATVSSGPSSRS